MTQEEKLAETAVAAAEEPYPPTGYAWYVVATLTFVYMFSFIDRQILNLLVTPIRRDLGISDTQMSWLMGTAFAFSYILFGILFGRLTDSRSRRTIIAAGFVAWSVFTAGCGLARTYVQMPIVGAMRPWQVVFFIVGLPGVLLALLMYTVREPLRRGAKMARAADGTTRVAQVPLSEVLSYLGRNKLTFLCHNVGFALLSFSSYGSGAWIPTFLQRNHGWTIGESGIVYGIIVAIFGTLGVALGGRFADWMSERGRRDAAMRVGLIVSLAWLPTGVLYPLVSDATLVAVLIAPAVFLASAPFGVAAAAIQQMMPNNMRGQASAIYLFVINFVGLGIGPSAVAIFTDYVFRGDESVRYSLLIVATAAHLIAAALLWAGLKPYRRSLDYLKEWTAAHG